MHARKLLEVKNLSVAFATDEGVIDAVRGVDLEVFSGKTTGLVGESGSGKSVTALSVMRLLSQATAKLTSGEVLFNHPGKGQIDLLKLSAGDIQSIRGNQISMVFQEPMSSLNPVKRCGWQVAEGIIRHKGMNSRMAREKVISLFEEVQLPDPSSVYLSWPHELSGGQRQRVMIAMAMACDPALLIADEPTTALDVTVQKGILDLMKQLQRDHGMGILFITHDLGVIADVADHAIVMLDGKIVEQGPTTSLLDHPAHPYTKALIACRPVLSSRPVRLATVDDFMGQAAYRQNTEAAPERKARHEKLYDMPPVLTVRNLKTTFITARNFFGKPIRTHTAVNKVSFDVYKGETLGLVGESGCGKTTLGRSLMRLIGPTSGHVYYNGTDLSDLGLKALRRFRPQFQIIFQDPYASLTPGMMVGKAIMEPMRVHGILSDNRKRKDRVMELLLRVNLQEKHFYRYPHEFSGGQRQRICIARALALNPAFIICDEAVSALDVSVQAQVLNLLNEMKEEFGLTYIFISHDLSVVKYMSDRIMVMKDGMLIETGEADDLYQYPKQDYTKGLLNAIPGTTSPPSALR